MDKACTCSEGTVSFDFNSLLYWSIRSLVIYDPKLVVLLQMTKACVCFKSKV